MDNCSDLTLKFKAYEKTECQSKSFNLHRDLGRRNEQIWTFNLCNKISFIYSCDILLQIKITLSKVSCSVWKGNGFDLSNFSVWIMMGKRQSIRSFQIKKSKEDIYHTRSVFRSSMMCIEV